MGLSIQVWGSLGCLQSYLYEYRTKCLEQGMAWPARPGPPQPGASCPNANSSEPSAAWGGAALQQMRECRSSI